MSQCRVFRPTIFHYGFVTLLSLMLSACTLVTNARFVEANSNQASVPYYFQYDNKHEGERACNITSVAMVLDYFEVVPRHTGLRTPDFLYQLFGIKQQPDELADIFNQVAKNNGASVRDVFYDKGTIKQLRHHVQQGQPAIVHGWFTGTGHILVVTGFDGEFYTVNDPAGKWNLQKFSAGQYDTSQSGHNIRYPAAEFEFAINDNGTGDDLWLHLFVSEN